MTDEDGEDRTESDAEEPVDLGDPERDRGDDSSEGEPSPANESAADTPDDTSTAEQPEDEAPATGRDDAAPTEKSDESGTNDGESAGADESYELASSGASDAAPNDRTAGETTDTGGADPAEEPTAEPSTAGSRPADSLEPVGREDDDRGPATSAGRSTEARVRGADAEPSNAEAIIDERPERSGPTDSAETAESVDVGEPTPTRPADPWSVRTIVSTLIPLLMLMSMLQMGSGTVLETFEEQLLTQPSLLILVPVMIGTAGNLGSIMSARLTTQFHLGTLELSPSNANVRANVLAVFGLAATVFVLLGVSSWAIGRALGGSLGLDELLVISIVSGMLLAVWVVVVTSAAVYASYRLGVDPDDTTIPIVTNVCDVTGVLILFGVVSLVL